MFEDFEEAHFFQVLKNEFWISFTRWQIITCDSWQILLYGIQTDVVL